MKAVHKNGYVSVFNGNDVYVYTEDEFLPECYFFDPEIDEQEWHHPEIPVEELF